MTNAANTVIAVELYDGPTADAIGISLKDWNGRLDDATWQWLTDHGYGTDNPNLWINIVDPTAWAPLNDPIAQRFTHALPPGRVQLNERTKDMQKIIETQYGPTNTYPINAHSLTRGDRVVHMDSNGEGTLCHVLATRRGIQITHLDLEYYHIPSEKAFRMIRTYRHNEVLRAVI